MTTTYKDVIITINDITEYKKEFQKIKEYYDLDDNDIYYIDSIYKDKKQLNKKIIEYNNNSINKCYILIIIFLIIFILSIRFIVMIN